MQISYKPSLHALMYVRSRPLEIDGDISQKGSRNNLQGRTIVDVRSTRLGLRHWPKSILAPLNTVVRLQGQLLFRGGKRVLRAVGTCRTWVLFGCTV